MNLKDRFINAFDSIFLVAIVAWSLTIATALVHPAVSTADAPEGQVEVYALVADGA